MKAAYLNQRAGADALIVDELPQPTPGVGEVLVKVRATAITPTEPKWAPTFTSRDGTPRPFPIILGHEFSGEIAAVGPDVSDFDIGDEVYGMSDWFKNGAQAEFCVAPATFVAPKPQRLDHAHAATVPISALTAWQALVVRGDLRHGETILIHGAAGAVGLFATQIARECGARVIATTSAADRDFVRSLGADEVIDYRAERFDEKVHDVDFVFDTVGGDTLSRSWRVLGKGGRLLSIVSTAAGAADARTRDAFLLVEADRAQLAVIANVIDAGRRRTFVAQEFPLDRVRDAYANASRGGNRGKTVLRITT